MVVHRKSDRIATLTKGEAANIIVRLKHGAQVIGHISTLIRYTNLTQQSRFEKKMKTATKIAYTGLKEKLRQAKEAVVVGPLSV